MKVLFLDVDGVLNSHQSIRASIRGKIHHGEEPVAFCPIACSNLIEVIARVPGLQIVVSSSWRIGRTLEELRKDLGPSGIPSDRIIDMTPVLQRIDRERGDEIHRYLKDRKYKGFDPITQFVIVDDNSDMGQLKEHLVQTDVRMGLMWDKALEILTKFGIDAAEIDRGWI